MTGNLYTEGVLARVTGGKGLFQGAAGFLTYTLSEPNTGARSYNLYLTASVQLPAHTK